jgi:hypothetical protein
MSQADNQHTIPRAQQEALDRAQQGQALTNYPAICEGFIAKGIAEADIKPRENVFTFNAWKAPGLTPVAPPSVALRGAGPYSPQLSGA